MIVLVTGATSGIGKAIAEIFAANKYDVIITGRRKERLDTLTKELTEKYAVKVLSLCFDVRDKQAVEQKLNGIPSDWKKINVLVNAHLVN